jgi:hypothetical protein
MNALVIPSTPKGGVSPACAPDGVTEGRRNRKLDRMLPVGQADSQG